MHSGDTGGEEEKRVNWGGEERGEDVGWIRNTRRYEWMNERTTVNVCVWVFS